MSLLTHSEHMVWSHLSRTRLPVISAVAVRVAWLYLLWTQRRRTRTQLRQLPPHLLRDIGLAPDDARMEADKPFWRP